MSLFYRILSFAAFSFLGSFLLWGSGLLLPSASILRFDSPQEVLQEAMQDLEITKARLEQSFPLETGQYFSQLPTDTPFPYYLLRNGRLQYWSDNTYIPTFLNRQAPGKALQLHVVPGGSYLLFKQPLAEDELDLCILLPLQADAGTETSLLSALPWLFPERELQLSRLPLTAGQSFRWDDEPVFWYRQLQTTKTAQASDFWSASLLLLGWGAFAFAFLFSRRRSLRTLFPYLIGLWGLRIVFLLFKLPFRLYPFGLFDAQYYASSQLNPSLGDLFLNLCLLLISLLVLYRAYKRGLMRLAAYLNSYPKVYQLFPLLYGLFLFWGLFSIQKILFFHTQYSLDITQAIQADEFRIVSWLCFLLSGGLFFLLAFGLLQSFRPSGYRSWIVVLLLGALLSWLTGQERWLMAGLSALLLFAGSRLIYSERETIITGYPFALLLLIFMSITALGAARNLQNYRQEERRVYKEQLASALLLDNDPIAEFLLAETAQKIQSDAYILNRMFNPFLSKDGILQKIRLMLMPRYLDKYDARIYLFQSDGTPLASAAGSPATYSGLQRKAQEDGEQVSEYPGLYLLNEPLSGSAQRYLQFVPIRMQGVSLGYVVLDLGLKRFQPYLFPNTHAPDLSPPEGNVTYAVYQQNSLVYNAGPFDYVHDFNLGWFRQPELYSTGISEDGYHHLGVRGTGGKVVVISDLNNAGYVLLQNFAFFVLLVLVLFLLLWIAYVLTVRLRFDKLSLAVKIQLYLNLAIVLPLLIVTISTLSLLRSLEKAEAEQAYYNRADNISRNLGELMELQPGGDFLETRVAEIARFTGSDLHVYSPGGRLIASSQPSLFQHNYLSEYLKPEVYAEIREQNSRQIIATEVLGELEYKSAYMAIRSARTGVLLGVLSLPFFDSGLAMQAQEAAVFNNITTIFVLVFLISFIALYFLSRQLTRPLRYLAEKLKMVSLSGHNEPLSWQSEDEVGQLVQEYNTMLVNLQASKQALTRTEKESAWREMAKQVAHEIKNPLTPMKLSLQHLNRMLRTNLQQEPAVVQKVDKTVGSLLAQIDTLSDIATSFSAFAKMPVPETARFDVVALLQNVLSLFRAEDAELEVDIPSGSVFVLGDAGLMQRTFNNLIKNGLQAVPEERRPHIHVSAARAGEYLRIRFGDNGVGIAPDIHDKVFLPNFSTKFSGSGLGLAIAKRGIEHAGGRIWFETELGQGTVFFIELPIAE